MARIVLFLLFVTSLLALPKRELSHPLKTSIVIPCHPDHFPHLENLLLSYQNQTLPPDEVVISLSEAQSIPSAELLALEHRPWPFSLRILKHKAKYPPGRNRNEACAASTGDLLLCQDADDLPHPQRVEIIKHLFETYEIHHLLHQWIGTGESFEPYDLSQLAQLESHCESFKYYFHVEPIPRVHNGSASFLRSVFNAVHWKPMTSIQEDVLFNQAVYALCTHKVVLSLPLLLYRFELSTFDLNGDKKK